MNCDVSKINDALEYYRAALILAIKPFYDHAVAHTKTSSKNFDPNYKNKKLAPASISTYSTLTLLNFLKDSFEINYSFNDSNWDAQMKFLSDLTMNFNTLMEKAKLDSSNEAVFVSSILNAAYTGKPIATKTAKHFKNLLTDEDKKLKESIDAFKKSSNTLEINNISNCKDRIDGLKELQKYLELLCPKALGKHDWKTEFEKDCKRTGYSYTPYNSIWPIYIRFFTTDNDLAQLGLDRVPFCVAMEKFIAAFAQKINEMDVLEPLKPSNKNDAIYNEAKILEAPFFDEKNTKIPYCMIRSLADICANPLFPFAKALANNLLKCGDGYFTHYHSYLDWHDWTLITNRQDFSLNDKNRKAFQANLRSIIDLRKTSLSELQKSFNIPKSSRFYASKTITKVSFANLHQLSYALHCSIGFLRLETNGDPNDYSFDYVRNEKNNHSVKANATIFRLNKFDRLKEIAANPPKTRIIPLSTKGANYVDLYDIIPFSLDELKDVLRVKILHLFSQGLLSPSLLAEEYGKLREEFLAESRKQFISKLLASENEIDDIIDNQLHSIYSIKEYQQEILKPIEHKNKQQKLSKEDELEQSRAIAELEQLRIGVNAFVNVLRGKECILIPRSFYNRLIVQLKKQGQLNHELAEILQEPKEDKK